MPCFRAKVGATEKKRMKICISLNNSSIQKYIQMKEKKRVANDKIE